MSASETDSPPDVPGATLELRRERVERVTVRRGRSRSHRNRKVSWTPAARRGALQAFLVCVGVLVVMGIGLYLGLSGESASPA